MNFLTREQLEKLPTPRILAYKRKMMTQRFMLSDCNCRICRSEGLSKLWDDQEASIEAAKEVLATREHVARPSKPLRTRRGRHSLPHITPPAREARPPCLRSPEPARNFARKPSGMCWGHSWRVLSLAWTTTKN